MKISTAIKRLQSMKYRYGDLDVFIGTERRGEYDGLPNEWMAYGELTSFTADKQGNCLISTMTRDELHTQNRNKRMFWAEIDRRAKEKKEKEENETTQ